MGTKRTTVSYPEEDDEWLDEQPHLTASGLLKWAIDIHREHGVDVNALNLGQPESGNEVPQTAQHYNGGTGKSEKLTEMYKEMCDTDLRSFDEEEFKEQVGQKEAGRLDHREQMVKALSALSEMGFHVFFDPKGTGTSTVFPPVEMPDTLSEAQNAIETLKQDFPTVYDIAGGDVADVDIVSGTVLKPWSLLVGLSNAMDANRTMVYVASSKGKVESIENILGDALSNDGYGCMRDNGYYASPIHIHDTVDDVFSGALVDDFDSGHPRWRKDGEKVVYENDETRYLEFESMDQLETVGANDFPVQYRRDEQRDAFLVEGDVPGSGIMYDTLRDLEQDWTRVSQPFVPEVELPREPTPDDIAILYFDEDDELQQYEF